MKFSHFSLLAALALNAVVCHAAEAQCALADFRFEAVPAHRRMMKRTLTTVISGMKSMTFAPMKHAAKPLASAMKKVRKLPSRQAATQQGAGVADDLKHMAASGKGVEDAFSIQQSKLMDAEEKLIQANKELKRLEQARASLGDINKAQRAQSAASKAVKDEQTELKNLAIRLNSGLREKALRSRKVSFQTGPPQIFGEVLTKAEQDMVEAQLKLKELTKSLPEAEATLLFSTPAAQKSIAALAKQSSKVDDLQKAFDEARDNLTNLKNSGATSEVIAQAEKAKLAAAKSLREAQSKLTELTKSVDNKALAIFGKNERIGRENAKAAGEGDRLLDEVDADTTELDILARETAERNRGPAFNPGVLDIAGTKVVKESVAKANVKQLTQEVEQAKKLLDEATEVVSKQGGNTKVLATSAVRDRLKPLRTAEDDLIDFQVALRKLELENAKKIKAGQQPDLGAVNQLNEGVEEAVQTIKKFNAKPKSLEQAIEAAKNSLTESQLSLQTLVKSNADAAQIKAANEALVKATKKVEDLATALAQ